MKTSFPGVNLLIVVMALTLVITILGSIAQFGQISRDSSYQWFGYAPTSIQPVQSVQDTAAKTEQTVQTAKGTTAKTVQRTAISTPTQS